MNNRVIILEGPDGCGKTTLANMLIKDYGFRSQHVSRPEKGEDVFKTYSNHLLRALRGDQPVVFDRLYLGERIYGPIMRGHDLLGEEGQRLIERIVRARDVKTILCLTDYDSAVERWKIRGDDYILREDSFSQVYDRYQKSEGIYKVYDFNQREAFEKTGAFVPSATLPQGTLGSPRAEYLFVGDIVNHRVVDDDLPFYSMSGSSSYLMKAIWAIPEHQMAFTNATNMAGDQRDLLSVVGRMPNFKIAVALGRSAEKACKDQGIPFEFIRHPSCAKRFWYKDLSKYANEIREALGHANLHQENLRGSLGRLAKGAKRAR